MLHRSKQITLSPEAVLHGYDAVSRLYPHIPPLLLWRSWEYAAYQRYTLTEPVLDVGCGDGRYFQLAWPQVRDAVGIDMDPGVVAAAQRSSVYREVHVSPAHQMPVVPGSMGTVFANCALEHMDRLDDVLHAIQRSLRPGGTFLCSVVNNKMIEWSALPRLVAAAGAPEHARVLQQDYVAYHHLVNPFSSAEWSERIERAGFEVIEHTSIVPEMSSRLFLLMDQLWHVKRHDGEYGDLLYPYLQQIEHFSQGMRQIVMGLLTMEQDCSVGSGVVFYARRSR